MTDPTPATPAPAAPKKRGRAAPPPNETAADRFRRVGNIRINNALNAIALLEALANKSQYEYTDEQRDKLFTALRTQCQKLETRFANPAATKAAPTSIL